MGNKRKLINKGLINLFPQSICTFYDMCAGSAIVSMNTVAEKYVVNDNNTYLVDLYNLFKQLNEDYIIKEIKSRIKQFGLAEERTKRNQYYNKEKLLEYKNAYMALRKHYNDSPPQSTEKLLDFYTLMFYSFSQQFRFNSKGEFNMPVGNDYFSVKNETYIRNGCIYFGKNNVCISNNDFRRFQIEKLEKNDFVYLDPPYINSTATYNENNSWGLKDELNLYKFCENLNLANIRWGLSNVITNKGKINQQLIEWCEQNKWYIYHKK